MRGSQFAAAAFGWYVGFMASMALALAGAIHGPAVFFASSALCGAGLGIGWRMGAKA